MRRTTPLAHFLLPLVSSEQDFHFTEEIPGGNFPAFLNGSCWRGAFNPSAPRDPHRSGWLSRKDRAKLGDPRRATCGLTPQSASLWTRGGGWLRTGASVCLSIPHAGWGQTFSQRAGPGVGGHGRQKGKERGAPTVGRREGRGGEEDPTRGSHKFAGAGGVGPPHSHNACWAPAASARPAPSPPRCCVAAPWPWLLGRARCGAQGLGRRDPEPGRARAAAALSSARPPPRPAPRAPARPP